MPQLTAKKLVRRITIAAAALLCVMIACSLIGSEQVSFKAVIDGIFSNNTETTINPDYEIYVRVRLPRILLGAMVGAALACAGVVFQALLRNPLADPYILGISSGAGLGAMIAIISGITVLGQSSIAVFAFVGAIATVWLVWAIGRITGKSSMTGLLLAGVVVNSFFSAIIMFLTTIAKSSEVHSTLFWLMGNIREESYMNLWITGGLLMAGITSLYFISPQLNVISFGVADAKSMGINVGMVQTIAFAIAAFITAIAVSASGLVGFVGLVVPHAIRLIFGPDHRQLLWLSAIIGGTFLVAADTLARVIVAPAQLPVGVVTALIGGPFFLVLLIKYTRKIGWMGK